MARPVIGPARSTPDVPAGARLRAGRSRRRLALVAVAAAAFLAGLAAGRAHQSETQRIAERYVRAWSRGDYAAMHALLTAESRRATPAARFAAIHRRAAATATLDALAPGRADDDGAVTRIPFRAETRIFGTLRLELGLPVAEGEGVAWRPDLAFPGLRRGEALNRRTVLPPRAGLLAADGTVLARRGDRAPAGDAALAALTGALGPPPPERLPALTAGGVPPQGPVGLTGLERWLDAALSGRPGGVLRAGSRVLAQTGPLPAADVRTSIDVHVQRAAVTALAGRLGGIVALRPATGRILAVAGIGASAPQPPGSTFKMVTLAAALQDRVVRPTERFAVQTAATLEGVELQNANGEACGGTLEESFAESCNSVFAPLGARLGARRLVAMAERFGFNAPPPLPGAAASTLPAAGEVGDDLAVGSTAIGQGRVLATALQMAWAGATIGNGGVRVEPGVRADHRGGRRRVVGRRAARFVRRAMQAVVAGGTGVAAAIPGVRVAGKTGTAELRTTQGDTPGAPTAAGDTTDTDAWFVAFAPARRPRVAVAVLLVGQGSGGATAAPAARGVLEAALGR